MSTRSRSAASATSSSISAAVIAGGFSTSTCFPASSARRASSACVGTGVATTTASSASSASSSSKSVVARACGKRAARSLECAAVRVADPREVGERVEVSREVGAPVAEARYGDSQSFQTLSERRPVSPVAFRKSTTSWARSTTSS